MLLNGIFSGLIFFSSFAMRTPNDQSIIQDDYEVTFGFKTNKVYMKRDWERELGRKYVDDEAWAVWTPSMFYVKPQYVNKTSRKLEYTKLDTRLKKDSYTIGSTIFYSGGHFENAFSVGIHKKKVINGKLELETKFDGYYFKNVQYILPNGGVGENVVTSDGRFDMEDYVSLNWKITDRIVLSNIFDYKDIKDKKYYKFKIGIEYKF